MRLPASTTIGVLLAMWGGLSHGQEDAAFAGPVQNFRDTLAYWTPARMQEAHSTGREDPLRPPTEEVITPGGDEDGSAAVAEPYQDVSSLVGELFFYDPGLERNSHCTASVLKSRTKRLLVTAAHCLLLGQKPLRWNGYPMFVPAYNGKLPVSDPQRAPYGLWPVRQGYVDKKLESDPELIISTAYDIAVAAVFDQLSRPVQDVVGGGLVAEPNGAGVQFSLLNFIGYPAAERYGGASQFWCLSRMQSPSNISLTTLNCASSSGYSGSPVLSVEDSKVGPQRGVVVGVVHSPGAQARLLPGLFEAILHMAESANE